jgi:hypothetical protein
MTFLLPAKRQKVRSGIARDGRIRCPGHLKFVRSYACCVPFCIALDIEAAHVRLGSHAGMGEKPDDTKAISLCSRHHAEQHRIGEATFAAKYQIDLQALALNFAKISPHRHKWMKP